MECLDCGGDLMDGHVHNAAVNCIDKTTKREMVLYGCGCEFYEMNLYQPLVKVKTCESHQVQK